MRETGPGGNTTDRETIVLRLAADDSTAQDFNVNGLQTTAGAAADEDILSDDENEDQMMDDHHRGNSRVS